MVKINGQKGGKTYDYPHMAMDTYFVNKVIKEDFSKFCKEHKINKSQLVEDFMKRVVLRFKAGSTNQAVGYITVDVMAFKKP